MLKGLPREPLFVSLEETQCYVVQDKVTDCSWIAATVLGSDETNRGLMARLPTPVQAMSLDFSKVTVRVLTPPSPETFCLDSALQLLLPTWVIASATSAIPEEDVTRVALPEAVDQVAGDRMPQLTSPIPAITPVPICVAFPPPEVWGLGSGNTPLHSQLEYVQSAGGSAIPPGIAKTNTMHSMKATDFPLISSPFLDELGYGLYQQCSPGMLRIP